MNASASANPRLRQVAALGALFLFALLIRLYYVGVAQPGNVVRGDSVDYVTYARNVIEFGTFSRERTDRPRPDAYRGPGYPALVAATMLAAGPDAWPSALRAAQAVLGAAACVLVALLVIPTGGLRWGAAAATLLALWPHHIAATMDILVEVAFGTLLLGWLVVASHAWRTGSTSWGIASGTLLGVAALTNPVALALLPALVPWAWRAGRLRVALGVLAGTLLIMAPWSMRNLSLPAGDGGGRAEINLVQGSWPSYHAAYRSRNAHPEPKAIIAAIDAEVALMRADRSAGFSAMVDRMAEHPWQYLAWYALEKPFLLWGWDIRIGAGGIYTFPVEMSPLERHPVLSTVTRGLAVVNPWLTLLTLVGAAVWSLLALRRAAPIPAEAILVALSALCLTLVHVVLQAEPRYANAYRGLEAALLAICLAALARRISRSNTPAADAGAIPPPIIDR